MLKYQMNRTSKKSWFSLVHENVTAERVRQH